MIGPPCDTDGPDCEVEGEVCYGATITDTDTTHDEYHPEFDPIIKEITNTRWCMNE